MGKLASTISPSPPAPLLLFLACSWLCLGQLPSSHSWSSLIVYLRCLLRRVTVETLAQVFACFKAPPWSQGGPGGSEPSRWSALSPPLLQDSRTQSLGPGKYLGLQSESEIQICVFFQEFPPTCPSICWLARAFPTDLKRHLHRVRKCLASLWEHAVLLCWCTCQLTPQPVFGLLWLSSVFALGHKPSSRLLFFTTFRLFFHVYFLWGF